MEKAIKVRGRCLLPPRFVPVAFLSAPAEKAERTWSERFQGLPCFGLPRIPWTAFYCPRAKGLYYREGCPTSPSNLIEAEM